MDLLLRGEEPAEDTDLVARRLGRVRHGVHAAPADLDAAGGAPAGPGDLLRHRCLLFKPPQLVGRADEWRFERDGEIRNVTVPGAVVSSDRDAVIALAVGGAGIMRLGLFDPALLASGALVPLLPGWTCPPGPQLYALYRRTPRLPARIAAFLDFTAECLAVFDPEERTFVRETARPSGGGGCGSSC